MVQKLANKRIDALLDDASVAAWQIKNNPKMAKIQPAGCLDPQEVFIAFSPAPQMQTLSKELAKRVSQGVQELKANGTWGKIFAKYGIKDK